MRINFIKVSFINMKSDPQLSYEIVGNSKHLFLEHIKNEIKPWNLSVSWDKYGRRDLSCVRVCVSALKNYDPS